MILVNTVLGNFYPGVRCDEVHFYSEAWKIILKAEVMYFELQNAIVAVCCLKFLERYNFHIIYSI